LPISDHDLLYLSGKATRSPGHDAALGDLSMAALFAEQGDLAKQLEATQSALHNAPAYAAAWDAREQALEAAGDQAALRALYAAGIEKFKNVDDLKVRYQARLADFELSSGDARLAAKLEDQMVAQNRRDRSDLSSAAAAESVLRLVSNGAYRDALREFNALARKLGRSGGGNFFYEVVRPLVVALRSDGREKDAQDILKEARKRMSPEPDSILAREFDELASPQVVQ
jgi:tetratricopeptide (TPR) repeat protein